VQISSDVEVEFRPFSKMVLEFILVSFVRSIVPFVIRPLLDHV